MHLRLKDPVCPHSPLSPCFSPCSSPLYLGHGCNTKKNPLEGPINSR